MNSIFFHFVACRAVWNVDEADEGECSVFTGVVIPDVCLLGPRIVCAARRLVRGCRGDGGGSTSTTRRGRSTLFTSLFLRNSFHEFKLYVQI